MSSVLTLKFMADAIVTGAALAAAVIGFLNHRAIQVVHLTMNSRLDQLIETTKSSSFAEGRASQTAEVATAAAKVLEDAATKAATVLETAAKKVE